MSTPQTPTAAPPAAASAHTNFIGVLQRMLATSDKVSDLIFWASSCPSKSPASKSFCRRTRPRWRV